ncbi:hypothetical protein HYW11_03915 [Candidatus Peregrinibacteria bacterium]|nr:hypothetical protein [Candidatus Peregrinibacteria bacterium]
MAVERADVPESPDEEGRRLRGNRAGKPGEGFADIRTVADPVYEEILALGRRLAMLSKRRAKELGYADNPEQLLLQCPTCGLMNDFTVDGRQVYYFSSEFRGDSAPSHSTTPHRIRIVALRDDAVQCQCGKCGEMFLQRVWSGFTSFTGWLHEHFRGGRRRRISSPSFLLSIRHFFCAVSLSLP